jgi:hypothetical protein
MMSVKVIRSVLLAIAVIPAIYALILIMFFLLMEFESLVYLGLALGLAWPRRHELLQMLPFHRTASENCERTI